MIRLPVGALAAVDEVAPGEEVEPDVPGPQELALEDTAHRSTSRARSSSRVRASVASPSTRVTSGASSGSAASRMLSE